MTTRIIPIKSDELIVDISDNLSWQEWHKLVIHVVQHAIKTGHPIALILIIDLDIHIPMLAAETIDYLLNPDFFKKISISSHVNQENDLLHTMLELLNSKVSTKWEYISFCEI